MITNRARKDMFGFNRTLEYLQDERQLLLKQGDHLTVRDLEWVDYLKAIGGPDNLKPAGIFKPSKELKTLVRRGIPVAFRPIVWQRISLSSIHRLHFPKNYYVNLLARIPDIVPRVREGKVAILCMLSM